MADEAALQKLVRECQELNSSDADETFSVPSALELARQIGLNRPLVVRRYAQSVQMPALEKWTRKYFEERMGEKKVSIAGTPHGNADALVDGHFVEPLYEEAPMHDFFERLLDRSDAAEPELSSQRASTRSDPTPEVVYLQSQNGNLSGDFKSLIDDVGTGIPLADEALGRPPDAVNLWIGDDRSVTSLHKDPYENFYVVLEGSKTFTLYPPTEFYCMHETLYPTAKYQRTSTDPSSTSRLAVMPDEDAPRIPWIPVDPLRPDFDRYPRFQHARPIVVEVGKGDMLYLPALWFHHVQQKVAEPGGMVVACNWWYDMDYAGSNYAVSRFIRRAVLALDGRTDEDDADSSES